MNAYEIPIEISLTELLRELHEKRQLLETASTERKALEERTRQDNQVIYDTETCLRSEVTALESAVRAAALRLYDADPEKKKQVEPGVSIRVSSEYVYDRAIAFEWAKAHGLCLLLDSKAFNDLCKTDCRPEFVAVEENRMATIATDLGKALEG